MKRKTIAIMTIVCLMVVSLSAFAVSSVQIVEPAKIQNEKTTKDANIQSTGSAGSQTFNSDNLQSSRSDAIKDSDKVDDSYGIQNEQTHDKNASIVFHTETNQSQSPELPMPLPDGRIFLGSPWTEDAIPYIPTENPKTGTRTPILPPEMDY